jgi:ligand-binding SRPBCC domain-containing protein
MPYLHLATEIHASAEICFDLSRDIDVHLSSMTGSRERAVGGVTSGLIGLDEEVTWQARHLGRWWRITSRITAFNQPYYFVDEMRHGPFVFFRHEHRFEDQGAITIMLDVVEYRSPLGPLGRLADVLFVERYLRRLLRVRNRYIKRMAEI